MEDIKIWKKILIYGATVILFLGLLFTCVGYNKLQYSTFPEENTVKENKYALGELIETCVVEQSFINHAEFINGVKIRFGNYGNTPFGTIFFKLSDEKNNVLISDNIKVEYIKDSADYNILFGKYLNVKNEEKLKLTLIFNGGEKGHALALWAGDRHDGWNLKINGNDTNYQLYLVPLSYVKSDYMKECLLSIFVILCLFIFICIFEIKCIKQGIKRPLIEFIHIFDKYRFLLEQLVIRDFKNKYRRSYLGVLWSLLNPLLMMIIVSSVFSYVFRFQIQNFQVYLILGQFIFSFYAEATQVSVQTIVTNGQLIKKVYLPKYIFPLSKTIFSFINSLISFIAVMLVMFYYGIPLTVNIIYLPFMMVTYFIFVLGVCLFLSCITVFLRDTQYLYGLIITAMGYLTPIFYPVDSLAPWMKSILKINPLYHYLEFIRTILLYGEPPTVSLVIICVLMAIGSFALGLNFFFKKQNNFILHI